MMPYYWTLWLLPSGYHLKLKCTWLVFHSLTLSIKSVPLNPLWTSVGRDWHHCCILPRFSGELPPLWRTCPSPGLSGGWLAHSLRWRWLPNLVDQVCKKMDTMLICYNHLTKGTCHLTIFYHSSPKVTLAWKFHFILLRYLLLLRCSVCPRCQRWHRWGTVQLFPEGRLALCHQWGTSAGTGSAHGDQNWGLKVGSRLIHGLNLWWI